MLVADPSPRLLRRLSAHLLDTAEGVDGEAAPYQYIGNRMDVRKCLTIHEDTEQEHDRRREVLENADQGQADALGSKREQQKRNRCNHTCPHHDQAVCIDSEVPPAAAFKE